MILYFCGSLDRMFIQPTRISAHETIHEVTQNDNQVEITFAEPITEFSSIYTSGFDPSTIVYSEDHKTVYIVFPEGLHEPFNAILGSSSGLDGKVVRNLEFDIKN